MTYPTFLKNQLSQNEKKILGSSVWNSKILVTSNQSSCIESSNILHNNSISHQTFMNPYQPEKIRGMLLGMFIGDALAMPVHWYYDTKALQQDYGSIRDMQAPKEFHPNSLLHLSNTGGHGRGQQHGSIVGDVILKGRKEFWAKPKLHYHHALRAGENTLNLQCLRVLLRSSIPEYSADGFLDAYVDFMTTADTYQDTYAESFHRDFFAKWAKGKPAQECAGPEDHNTASVGGLVLLPPVLVKSSGDWLTIRTQLRLTHRSPKLEHYAEPIMELFNQLLLQEHSEAIRDQALEAAKPLGVRLSKLLEETEHKIGRINMSSAQFSAQLATSNTRFPLFTTCEVPARCKAGLDHNAEVGGMVSSWGDPRTLLGAAGGECFSKTMDRTTS